MSGDQRDKYYELMQNVSFISTVYNEEKSIAVFLKSFFEQSYLPEEIIFVDGGSKDNTVNILRDFFSRKIKNDFGLGTIETDESCYELKPEENVSLIGSYKVLVNQKKNRNDRELSVRLLQKINANISEGRNIAIKNARNEIICASDAGCVLDKNWVYEITKYILPNHNEEANLLKYDVAGGYSRPITTTFLEKILSMSVMPKLKEIKARKFMPSSRNISFKKSAWDNVGGYPENMDYGEDMKFNFNLKEAGYEIKFNPDAVVYWKMRENIILIFKQFFRYAKGDARGKMYTYRHIVRFLSAFAFAAVLSASVIFSPWFLFIYLPFFAGYVYKPYSRLGSTFIHVKNHAGRFFIKIAAIIFAPMMLAYIDMAKISGYIYGLVKN
ncbi:MAG: glycosyltransferase [Actinobacteria bacterium]|nr:glycosyltransferase [Actinomycetota bacterium]